MKDERDYADGFDQNQQKLLKSRKTRRKCLTEVGYWNEVYKILFPDVEESRIPTACKKSKHCWPLD